MDGMQPDECTPEVGWEVRWHSPLMPGSEPVVMPRRNQIAAIELAREQKKRGFETKLYRVELTEVDF